MTGNPRPNAIFLALLSVLLWSFLATFGAGVSRLSPFLVVGVALCVAGIATLPGMRQWRIPWRTLVVGTAGIFGYHFLYFTAFQIAPAVEANLINYLWPLLIVLLSPLFLPHYKLRPHHLAGASIGMLGAALILTGGRFSLDLANIKGYLIMAGAALTWASYSLMTKRLSSFPTGAVGLFCLVSGVLSLTAYFLSTPSEIGLADITLSEWVYLFLLGAGPMGTAFFTWDAALKRGDPRIIGALAYLTPMTSTILLATFGGKRLSLVSAIAMLLIILGAVIGSIDLLRKPLSTSHKAEGPERV